MFVCVMLLLHHITTKISSLRTAGVVYVFICILIFQCNESKPPPHGDTLLCSWEHERHEQVSVERHKMNFLCVCVCVSVVTDNVLADATVKKNNKKKNNNFFKSCSAFAYMWSVWSGFWSGDMFALQWDKLLWHLAVTKALCGALCN